MVFSHQNSAQLVQQLLVLTLWIYLSDVQLLFASCLLPHITFPHLRSPSHIFAFTTFDLSWARTLSLSGAAGASGKSINSLFHSHGQWGKVLTGEFAFAAQNILKYAEAEVHTRVGL